MAEFFPNASQGEREGLMDSLKRLAGAQGSMGDFVNVTGDTLTGELVGTSFNAPNLAITSTASFVGPTIFKNVITGQNLGLTSTASFTGPVTFDNVIRGQNMVLSSTVSMVGPVTFSKEIRGVNLYLTSIASINAANIYSTVATVNPLILGFNTGLAGGPTIAPLTLVASTASQCFFDFRGAVATQASVAYDMVKEIRVRYVDEFGVDGVGYLPILQRV